MIVPPVPDAGAPGALAALPFDATLFFPLSGNPIAFNHLAAAEWLLRARPAWRRVVFILGNGHHPDPTKPGAEVDAATRLALCRLALGEVADPERSLLARQAAQAGETLRLGSATAGVSTRELGEPRAVRATEMMAWLRAEAPAGQGPLAWFVGADLVRRMADPRIFSDEDLRGFATHARLALLERPGEPPAAEALARLRAARGVTLAGDAFPLAEVPAWLRPFLDASSTLLRHAAEAGDPVGGLLPRSAAERIVREGLYRAGRPAARVVTAAGAEIGARTVLQLEVERARAALDVEAGRVFDLLTARRAAGRPHGLALVECTVGGTLTASLAGRSGASRFFRQARFAYDRRAKENLLGPQPEGASSTSPETVRGLAEALRREAGADFGLAESGSAGPPDGVRRSFRNGECWLAVAGPAGARTEHVALNPFLTRQEHIVEFSRRALALLRTVLEAD